MSMTSHGKYLWPPGTGKKKKTGSPEEPLQAISSSSSSSSSSSTPLGLCLYLKSQFPYSANSRQHRLKPKWSRLRSINNSGYNTDYNSNSKTTSPCESCLD
ncbi:unnamed protein product [Pleuronectes platessa]|uniref:Uncharacterized protein n=1 Tax=Pleuronectes platessa TaxID=8262 RepID=A0A9N7VKX6_PLEPL|nr:unnamed protein product [Pleuronectes platessa]